jgi:hypothetical protein
MVEMTRVTGIGSALHVVVVLRRTADGQHVVQCLTAILQHHAVALVVVSGQSCVEVEGERLAGFLRDDVDYATCGIRAVECRRRTFDDLDVVHLLHVESGKVDILHRLTGQTLAVDEDEHALTAEAGEVHVRHLVHRIAELNAGHQLLQQVLNVGGIRLLYVFCRDDVGEYRRFRQHLRRPRTRDHHLLQVFLREE